MKKIFLLIVTFCVLTSTARAQSTSDLLSTSYSIEIAPTSLIEAIGIIRAKTGVRFLYSPSSLPTDQLMQISAKDLP